eukprot:6186203-Pleurochrysis_carterae.AAC.5
MGNFEVVRIRYARCRGICARYPNAVYSNCDTYAYLQIHIRCASSTAVIQCPCSGSTSTAMSLAISLAVQTIGPDTNADHAAACALPQPAHRPFNPPATTVGSHLEERKKASKLPSRINESAHRLLIYSIA